MPRWGREFDREEALEAEEERLLGPGFIPGARVPEEAPCHACGGPHPAAEGNYCLDCEEEAEEEEKEG